MPDTVTFDEADFDTLKIHSDGSVELSNGQVWSLECWEEVAAAARLARVQGYKSEKE